MDEPIWESTISNFYTFKVMPLGENMHRGMLEIWHTDSGELRYQKEVPINRMLENGADDKIFREWQKVVVDWVKNKS
jgi:hypothetical protein